MKYLVLISILLVGCMGPEYPHKFFRGDCVQMKLDGRKGMVLATGKYARWIDVRFSGLSLNSPLLGGDVSQKPYDRTIVTEVEIEACG